MSLALTDAEKAALIDLLVEGIGWSHWLSRTDLLNSILRKVWTDVNRAAAQSTTPLDESILSGLRELRHDGGPDALIMVVTLFLKTAPAILKELAHAAATEDMPLLLSASYKLHGISANVGARVLAGCCKQLENAVRSGSIPTELAIAEVESISQAYEAAEAALNNLIHQIRGPRGVRQPN